MLAPGASLSGGPPARDALERLPALHLAITSDEGDDVSTFPSVGDRVSSIALDSVALRPNQPETGELRLRVGEGMPVDVEPGSEITVAPLEHLAHVSVSSPQGRERTWFCERLRVEQSSGLHIVSRDGLVVGDVDKRLEISCRPTGLTRVHV
jgi:hypothetical protein